MKVLTLMKLSLTYLRKIKPSPIPHDQFPKHTSRRPSNHNTITDYHSRTKYRTGMYIRRKIIPLIYEWVKVDKFKAYSKCSPFNSKKAKFYYTNFWWHTKIPWHR